MRIDRQATRDWTQHPRLSPRRRQRHHLGSIDGDRRCSWRSRRRLSSCRAASSARGGRGKRCCVGLRVKSPGAGLPLLCRSGACGDSNCPPLGAGTADGDGERSSPRSTRLLLASRPKLANTEAVPALTALSLPVADTRSHAALSATDNPREHEGTAQRVRRNGPRICHRQEPGACKGVANDQLEAYARASAAADGPQVSSANYHHAPARPPARLDPRGGELEPETLVLGCAYRTRLGGFYGCAEGQCRAPYW